MWPFSRSRDCEPKSSSGPDEPETFRIEFNSDDVSYTRAANIWRRLDIGYPYPGSMIALIDECLLTYEKVDNQWAEKLLAERLRKLADERLQQSAVPKVDEGEETT